MHSCYFQNIFVTLCNLKVKYLNVTNYNIDTVLLKAIFLVPLIIKTEGMNLQMSSFRIHHNTDNYRNGKALRVLRVFHVLVSGEM